MASSKQFTHHPTQPKNMNRTFFDLGYIGTSRSNIAAGYTDFHKAIMFGYITVILTG